MSAYLLGNIIFTLVWLVLWFAFRSKRKIQLAGSLLLLPFAVLDIWFRPNYWHPPLLIKAIEPLSIETAIYCFTAGGIAAAIGSLMLKTNAGKKINWKNIFYFLIFAFGLFAFFTLSNFSNAMNNLNFAFLLILIFLSFVDLKNIKSYQSAVVLAFFTIAAINLALLFFPDFVRAYWSLPKLWPTFLNTPTEEILFAAMLGALWSVLPKYIFKT